MVTAIVVPDAAVSETPSITAESIWTRFSARLKTWRSKFVAGVKRVGNWFVRAAKWVWNTAPVQWAVTKGQGLGLWAKGFIQRPIGMIVTGTAAVLFVPKVVEIVATVVLVSAAVALFRRRKLDPVVLETEGALLVTDNMVSDLNDRAEALTLQLDAAMAQGDESKCSALQGRLAVVAVRLGTHKVLKKDAAEKAIYDDALAEAKRSEPAFDWKPTAMRNAIRSELARLKRQEKARAELVSS